MKRQAVTPNPASPAQAAPAPTNPASAAGAATTPKRNWMGPIAGLAAGLGMAALLSHFGMGEGMANIVMIALLAMAAVFVFKLLFRRRSPVAHAATYPGEPMQFAGAGVSTTYARERDDHEVRVLVVVGRGVGTRRRHHDAAIVAAWHELIFRFPCNPAHSRWL